MVERVQGFTDSRFLVYVGLESEALIVQSYNGSLIPGLLQTPEYAEALVRRFWDDPYQIAKRVEFRMERQRHTLHAPHPPALEFVVGESALQRGDKLLMTSQLNKLQASSDLEHVDLRVLPSAAATVMSDDNFSILELAGRLQIVYSENMFSDFTISDAKVASTARRAFSQRQDLALNPDETRTLIRDISRRGNSRKA